MPWDWPVEVNFVEASAYCKWLSEETGEIIRIPTESEYESMMVQMMEQT